ncbi:hypothetical protein D3C76_917430 [compost metagenome]
MRLNKINNFNDLAKQHPSFIIIILLSLAISPLIIFTLIFWQSNADVSRSMSDWADFGSFVSGTIGTILSFLAFSGLIYSIHSQRKQHMLDSILNYISTLSMDIDTKINTPLEYVSVINGVEKDIKLTVDTALSLKAAAVELRGKEPELYDSEDYATLHAVNSIPLDINIRIMEIGVNLNLLAKSWEYYIDNGGHKAVINLNKMKYYDIVMNMHLSEIRFDTLQKNFNFEGIRELYRSGATFEKTWDFVCEPKN